MGFITVGLFTLAVGMILLDVRDSPTTWDSWDVSALLLMIAGVSQSWSAWWCRSSRSIVATGDAHVDQR